MSRSDGTLRAFIALPIPPPVKSGLERVVQRLTAQVHSGVRWVGLDGIHLTLKFLGDIYPSRVEDITEAVQRASLAASSFELFLSGLGTFPNDRRPRGHLGWSAGRPGAAGETTSRDRNGGDWTGVPWGEPAFHPSSNLGPGA